MKKCILFAMVFMATYCVFAQTIPSFSNDAPAKKPVRPKTGKTKKDSTSVTAATASSAIKFTCDIDAALFIDGEKKGDLKKEVPLKVQLAKGEYSVKVVSAENEANFKKWTYKVAENGLEKIEEVILAETAKTSGSVAAQTEEADSEATEEPETPLKEKEEPVAEVKEPPKKAVIVAPKKKPVPEVQKKPQQANDNKKSFIEMVTVGNFAIGKYEVTQAQWESVMGDNPSIHQGCGRCPVENVSWDDVQEFIQKLNQQSGKKYRLPTEAEWMKAARSNKPNYSYSYSGSDDISQVAWYADNGGSTHEVGTKKPNELGIYDMTGNVGEWCNDWNEMAHENRVICGGSWRNIPSSCRIADHDHNIPAYKGNEIGFRLVSTP